MGVHECSGFLTAASRGKEDTIIERIFFPTIEQLFQLFPKSRCVDRVFVRECLYTDPDPFVRQEWVAYGDNNVGATFSRAFLYF